MSGRDLTSTFLSQLHFKEFYSSQLDDAWRLKSRQLTCYSRLPANFTFDLEGTHSVDYWTMTYQTPTSSLGRPSNYTQQWPSNPSTSNSLPPSLPHPFPFNQNQMPAYQQSHDGARYSLDYNDVNFAANSLPGLGASGPAGSLPPPPFPFMGNFAHSQFHPPPFPPMQMPPLRYPPMPVSTAPINTPPSRPLTSEFQPNSGSVTNNHPQFMTSSAPEEDLEREEGELTDREGDCSQQGIESRHGTSPPSSKPTNPQMTNGKGDWANKTNCNGHVPKGSRCVSSEVEEGEASSTSSRSFSRDSGSRNSPWCYLSATIN